MGCFGVRVTQGRGGVGVEVNSAAVRILARTRAEEDEDPDVRAHVVSEKRERRARAWLRGLMGHDWAEREEKKRPRGKADRAEWAAWAEIKRGDKKNNKTPFLFS